MTERIVVVGGGVIGLCAAFALERRGCRVTVVTAGEPGEGASAVNAGWIVPSLSEPVPAPGLVRTSLRWMGRSDSPLYIQPRPNPELLRWLVAFWRHCNARAYAAGLAATAELNRRSFALYDELTAAGVRFEQHRTGVLFAYVSPAALEHDLRAMEPLRQFGMDVPSPVWGDDVRELEPALGDAITGGFWFSQERHIRPDTLTAGLVEHLTARGVEIRSRTRVTGFDRVNDRITNVRLERGRLEADAVLIAAGSWTPRVARLAGVRVPIQPGKGYCLDYAPPPFPVRHALYLHEARVAVTPLDGLTRLAGTMEFSGINDRIRPERVAAIARAGATGLRNWPTDLGTARAGSGMRPMTPDGLPVIGPLKGYRNLTVASGHAMLGVTLAPATGEAIAEVITTGRTPDILRPFDPGRF
ncbi:MAG: D-amino-acid dehydrogenase [Thermomicrobiales bacterium]|jgi:D-amino-acid dehydrogenase|nr:D-amino-acid dehydrogenase [Thermomicrobiales bacterium]